VLTCCIVTACGYRTSPRPASATIPGQVDLVTARAYPDRILLQWGVPLSNTDGSPLEDLSGFKVYRSAEEVDGECEDCGKRELHSNVDFENPVNAKIVQGEVFYPDERVSRGNVYRYWVAAYNLRGREGPVSPEVTVEIDRPPPAPQGVSVRVEKDGALLEWTSPARPAGTKGYRIYRGDKEDVDTMESVGETKWAETRFLDKGVQKEKTYYYVIRSLKMNDGVSLESLPSASVKAMIPKILWEAPENVNTMVTRDGIRIFWNPVEIEKLEVRYNVYRSDAGGIPKRLNPKPLETPWFHDKSVAKDKTYRYAVTAFPQGKPDEESRRSASPEAKFVP
jgi:hypothetical protein